MVAIRVVVEILDVRGVSSLEGLKRIGGTRGLGMLKVHGEITN